MGTTTLGFCRWKQYFYLFNVVQRSASMVFVSALHGSSAITVGGMHPLYRWQVPLMGKRCYIPSDIFKHLDRMTVFTSHFQLLPPLYTGVSYHRCKQANPAPPCVTHCFVFHPFEYCTPPFTSLNGLAASERKRNLRKMRTLQGNNVALSWNLNALVGHFFCWLWGQMRYTSATYVYVLGLHWECWR